MTASSAGLRRAVSSVCVAGGVLVVLFAVLADTFGGSPGFGVRQALLAVGGVSAALFGTWLRPEGRTWLRTRAVSTVRDAPLLEPGQVLVLALLFGIGTGLLEVCVLFGEKFLTGRMLRMGSELLWVLPLADTVVMVAVGAVLVLGSLVLKQLRAMALVSLVYAWLGLDAVIARLTLGQRVDGAARFILTLGVAVAVTRWLIERGRTGTLRLGRPALVSAAFVAVVAVAFPVSSAVRERIQLAQLAEAPAAAPNIVFLIWDTVRAQSLSLYGYDRPTTPNLERLAATGTTFDFALSTASWTLPSHGSMFTGHYPNVLNATWRLPLDDTKPTFVEALRDHGWATAAFSANMAYATRESGLGRGFIHFEDFFVSLRRMVFVSHMVQRNLMRLGLLTDRELAILGLKGGERVNRELLAWLDDQPADRPFFVFANYMDAHDPYHVEAPYDTLYGGVAEALLRSAWVGFLETDSTRIAAGRDAYDRGITYLDAKLSEMMDALRERGRLENTIVIVAADHGEHFGEHGFMRHGATLYLPVLHVPLVIVDPARVPAGVRVAEEVSTRDIAATILDLAGLREERRVAGTSLRRYWEGESGDGSWIYAETRQGIRFNSELPNANGDLHALLGDGFHLIRRTDTGAEELYNYTLDPAENVNLIETGGADSVHHAIRSALDVMLESDTTPAFARSRTAHARSRE